METSALPTLSEQPLHHSECCATLSKTLIETLCRLLPSAPCLTLSIGCGTGLLEALVLLNYCTRLSIQAVEVRQDLIRYLPKENTQIVKGTWELCALAEEARAWLWVYPREAALVQMYVDRFGCDAVRLVVWLGPRMDLAEYEVIFQGEWEKRAHEDCGVRPYEALVSWHRRNATSYGNRTTY